MKINLSNPNPATRFYFDDDDKARGWVELCICSPEKMAKIDRLTVKKRTEYRRGQRYEIEDVKSQVRNRMLWDELILSWSGIVDENDKSIKCTTDNKEVLMLNSVKFATFVGKKMEELSEGVGTQFEELEKN